MQCRKCGHKLKRNELFCTVCGYYNSENEDEDLDLNLADDEEVEEVVDEDEYVYDEQEDKANDDFDVYEELDKDDKSSDEADGDFYYDNEDCLESYIGEDYNIIKNKNFNIYAFLLSWAYVLYRKLYLTGIIGLFIIIPLLLKSNVLAIVYLIISMVLLGLFFNKYYLFVAKKKIERLIATSDDTDRFKMVNICGKKGGVSIVKALIVYLLFLVLLVAIMSTHRFKKTYSPNFFAENSENRANCLSLVKSAYKNKEELKIGEILEGACQIDSSGSTKEYNIYLKTEYESIMIYTFFTTEGDYLVYKNNTKSMNELMAKKTNRTITDEETLLLKEKQKIESTYKDIYDKSIEEDKLIDKNINNSEKLNYIYSDEEITR